ncbi:hypothetical protein ABZT17_14675 [Streptomyces sp. NPDC005648]|uniref:hypothetical protein n=1 Tax=Streptomyces sp. NPDC005648 TaxID=3157044 RepID=UPI0033AC2EE1
MSSIRVISSQEILRWLRVPLTWRSMNLAGTVRSDGKGAIWGTAIWRGLRRGGRDMRVGRG